MFRRAAGRVTLTDCGRRLAQPTIEAFHLAQHPRHAVRLDTSVRVVDLEQAAQTLQAFKAG